jgi:hypothetical protein
MYPLSTLKHSAPTGSSYSWHDDSNGEIYNDSSAVNDPDDPLYVVENGKEFPLTPVSKRRSFFQAQQEEITEEQGRDSTCL